MKYKPMDMEKYNKARELRRKLWGPQSIANEIQVDDSTVIRWTADIAKEIFERRVELMRRLVLEKKYTRKEICERLCIGMSTLYKYTNDIREEKRDYDFLGREVERLFLEGESKGKIKKKLNVSESFIRKHTKPLQKDLVNAEQGEYRNEQGVLFVACKYLAEYLDMNTASIYPSLREYEVPYIELLTSNERVSSNNGRLKFYEFDKVFELVPSLKERKGRIDDFNNLSEKHILRTKPEDLTDEEFKVLWALLVWRNTKDYWPLPANLTSMLRGMSAKDISRCFASLELKRYITIIYEHKNANSMRRIVVHKGPPELITRQVECAHCEHKFFVSRDYVENGAEP